MVMEARRKKAVLVLLVRATALGMRRLSVGPRTTVTSPHNKRKNVTVFNDVLFVLQSIWYVFDV